jgi:hypothetical protein
MWSEEQHRLSPALEARVRPGGTRARPLRHECIPLQLGGRLPGCRCRHHRRGSRRYCVPAGPTKATGGNRGPNRSTWSVELFFRSRTNAGKCYASGRRFEFLSKHRLIVIRSRRLPSSTGHAFRQPMTRSCAGLDGAAVSPKLANASTVESSAGSQVTSRCSSTSAGRSTS